MSAMSDWLENQLASHLFGSGTFTKPSVLAIALCRNVPVDADTGSTIPEVSNAGAYSRQSLNPAYTNWLDPVAVGGATHNLQDVTFPIATADWGWVSGVAICSSATHGAGNMYCYSALTTPKLIGAGDRFIFYSGSQIWTFA